MAPSQRGYVNMLEFRILGPVEIFADGRTWPVGPPQRRLTLAALAVDAGQVVSTDTLVDRIWDEAPPRARRIVQVHLSELRHEIERHRDGDQRPAGIVRRSGGYVLDVDPDQVDLHRASRLMAEAIAPDCPDPQRVQLLEVVLGLWSAEPLAGLAGLWPSRTRHAWDQRRIEVILAWARAQLRLGNSSLVVDRVPELAQRLPVVESLAGVVMQALHAAGRDSEALERYAHLQSRLMEDLGVDPGPESQTIYQAILRGEPARSTPPTGDVGRPGAMVRPAQLPADLDGFVGREKELTRLDRLLPTTPDRPVVTCVISGPPGVGKTALAIHWAWRTQDRFPDGHLWLNLRGFDPGGAAMTPGDALRVLLDALAVPPARIPPDVDARVGLYRTLMHGRRMLIVLDNARDASQVRPLLPGAAGCLVVITSRRRLSGLVAADRAHPVTLDLLSTMEATGMLAERLGQRRVAGSPVAVEQIIAACARLPLALAIVAARAASYPELSLAALAGDLTEATRRLDELTDDDPTADVRRVFSSSYRILSPGAARTFRLLGVHPGPDLAAAAGASLLAVPLREFRPLLSELVGSHLVTWYPTGRFSFHDLLAVYARELVQAVESEAERHEALLRLLDHYRHSARTATMLLDPQRDPIALDPPRPGVVPEEFAGHDEALAWFAAELPVLTTLVDVAVHKGLDHYVLQLAWAMSTFMDRSGYWADLIAIQDAAAGAARRLGQRPDEARARRAVGRAYSRLGHHDKARSHLELVLDLCEPADRAGQAHTHLDLTRTWELQASFEEALAHSRSALALYEEIKDRTGQARALNNVGWHLAQLGHYEQALSHCQQALALHVEVGNRHGEANTWDSLGYVHQHLGHHQQAVGAYERALRLFREFGDRYYEADVRVHLGDAYQAAGDSHGATRAWRIALGILDELHHPDAEQVRARLRPHE